MVLNRFVLHVIPGYITNIFLAEYEHGLLLLDCGAASDVQRIEDYCLQNLKRSPQDIKLAVVTHIHPDHSGGAANLRNRFGTLIASQNELDRWYAGPGGFIQHKLDRFMMQGVARRMQRSLEKTFFPRRINADFLLSDGDSLPIFQDWQAIHVPGHTSHDLVLYNQAESLLYVSDCVLEVKGKYQNPLPIMFPEQMLSSYTKLSTLDAATILLAHGEAIKTEDPRRVFTLARELLKSPPNKMTHRVQCMSVFSPEGWQQRNKQGC
ncbi:Beta-lactamase-like [Syntrophomonas zehnderi OL-4]|uniref:Beta-lactamase-like n=1 Tax=Syntrophomonas zehnderi OL-4 TaxID=690567 RepID=A0A0E4G9B3_9FIRM|nr:MBL fold metallo-hydrolase [Syntrophomonas zehnderi]CFX00853.1 Beta-lactamase-like [Syntrophomonas zehnderi OL-4]